MDEKLNEKSMFVKRIKPELTECRIVQVEKHDAAEEAKKEERRNDKV